MFSKFYLWIRFFPLAASLVITIIILFFLKPLPSRLPLFYSLPWGEKQLVTHQQFLIIPASITLLSLFNLIVSWQLHSSQTFFKNTLLISSLIVSVVLIVAFIKVVLMFIP